MPLGGIRTGCGAPEPPTAFFFWKGHTTGVSWICSSLKYAAEKKGHPSKPIPSRAPVASRSCREVQLRTKLSLKLTPPLQSTRSRTEPGKAGHLHKSSFPSKTHPPPVPSTPRNPPSSTPSPRHPASSSTRHTSSKSPPRHPDPPPANPSSSPPRASWRCPRQRARPSPA